MTLTCSQIVFSKIFGVLTAYMVAKGLSVSAALVLLITFLVIIPNYGTGTIETMQFLSVEQSHCIIPPKACKTKLSPH